MKKLVAVLFAFSALYFTGCKTDAGNPKTVLTSFFDALAKKDMAAARKLATADSKGMLDLMEMGMKMADTAASEQAKEQFDKSKMEIAEAKIDGDRATVNVKETKTGNAVDFVLKKEGGSWKVALDMSTLMGMGAEKMKEEGMKPEDMEKLKEEMEKFKNMSADSLKMMMEKGQAALDSMQAIMNK